MTAGGKEASAIVRIMELARFSNNTEKNALNYSIL